LRSPFAAWFSTVLPYRGAEGPVLITARSIDPPALPTDPDELVLSVTGHPWTVQLLHARPAGRRHPFAR
jgi:hypothetical protein